jgi:hypothetical protein
MVGLEGRVGEDGCYEFMTAVVPGEGFGEAEAEIEVGAVVEGDEAGVGGIESFAGGGVGDAEVVGDSVMEEDAAIGSAAGGSGCRAELEGEMRLRDEAKGGAVLLGVGAGDAVVLAEAGVVLIAPEGKRIFGEKLELGVREGALLDPGTGGVDEVIFGLMMLRCRGQEGNVQDVEELGTGTVGVAVFEVGELGGGARADGADPAGEALRGDLASGDAEASVLEGTGEADDALGVGHESLLGAQGRRKPSGANQGIVSGANGAGRRGRCEERGRLFGEHATDRQDWL